MGQKGLLSGTEGESLFTEPLLRYFRDNPLPELFKKTERLKDERLLAIVTALIVEDRIDAALKTFMPRYSRLTEGTDFTFSMKIALLEALGFIPSRITSAATLIRKIRNEFAHHLQQDSFSELEPKLISGVINLRGEVYGIFGEDEKRAKSTFVEEYRALVFYCLIGLDAYRENMAFLRTSIEKREFLENLIATCHAEDETQMKAILAQAPESVEEREGVRIERYSQAVVNVTVGEGAPGRDEIKVDTLSTPPPTPQPEKA